jgi:hypothetical protein
MKPKKDKGMSKTKTLLRDLAAIMLWRWERVNWTAVVTWALGGMVAVALYVGIALAAMALLTSCASTKEFHQQHQHTVEIDTLAHQAETDSARHEHRQDIDSIVTASVWAAMQEFVRQEQEHEVTTETLTETIDSLGRIIRQSQKTTERTLSRQEIERQQEQLQQVANQLHQRLKVMDAEWHESLAQMEASLRDSLTQQIDLRKETAALQPLTWWQKTWQWLKGILVGIVIGILITCWRNVLSDFKRIVKGGCNLDRRTD